MHKFSLALGAIIAITAMLAIPTTNFHVAKAYSCSSSSSTAHIPSSSSSVSGTKGSCSTSSSSSSTAGIGGVDPRPAPSQAFDAHSNPSIGSPGITTSSSSGGSQSSCSSSHTNQLFAGSFSQSQPGRCP